eukprot:862629-Pleurochrysis_carterae.AAC.4
MCTLPLDTAARIWDCYLRDGEQFVWRVVLELLRLLSPVLLALSEQPRALDVLYRASSLGGVHEKPLFHSLTSNSAAVAGMLGDFGQKLPMPTAESGGVCYDLWRNAEEADDEAGGKSDRRSHVCLDHANDHSQPPPPQHAPPPQTRTNASNAHTLAPATAMTAVTSIIRPLSLPRSDSDEFIRVPCLPMR